ncbi:MAG: DNA polymerase III subunit delta' [Desulfobacterales bacterium]
MPGFESLINQERPIRILTTLLKNRTLPHAFLFTGTEGVGKKAAAIALAMACNCQDENYGLEAEDLSKHDPGSSTVKSDLTALGSCGVCKSCRKIESGNHADIIRIQPSGSFIKIAQIRALAHTLAMRPYEAKTRVVVISAAQALNAAASNALLKILEEPPSRTMLVLIATHKSALLPTIVSRCQLIGFNPISQKNMAVLLREKHELAPQAAGILAAMANGSYSRAQTMLRSNWLKRRKWLIDEINTLSVKKMGGLLALAEKLSAEREELSQTLEVIKVWFRDLIIGQYDPEKIINQDVADKIRIASEKVSVSSLLSKVDAVQQAQNRITANTNLRLSMENLLIKLAQKT